MQNEIKIYNVNKSYEHYHELLMDGRADELNSDYSADLRVVQFHYS